ncbi:GDSL-type esterase/lipase family protein [Actinoplanes derwentensis]|uniref:GDSL-like Lipase/Acylhydrolase family protein n=1 Tax=Actinoplanes derwentensis TaxID=113562 RepID=A0A1H2A0S9_9ACTN|nr:GDSL-type esterase/lipase family protein [Actinoplanes derwentensis]GID83458.1 lipase [Actinoplanes derwentensis]SDT39096.1 GDSL-like Lipase/Acylhydrolase family protein [Actinoplanes derwentensis]
MITTPITADLLFGAAELETTEHGLLPHRLPAWARAQTSDPQLAMVEAQPSGVRLVFRTRATVVELDTLATRRAFTGLPERPHGVYDLLIDGRLAGQASAPTATVITVDLATGAADRQPGQPGTVTFTGLTDADVGVGADKTVEIWLPHNEITELVALRTDAPVEAVPPSGRPVWLHHGSSISHGSNATTPSGIWPAVAAAAAGLELINLGLGGSALLDPFTARTMRDTPADLISVKIGINLVNADLMRLRAFGPAVHGFLDTIRDGHPDTPLLVVSPIHCPIHEDTPGPGAFDMDALRAGEVLFRATGEPAPGRLTLRVIRDELARIVTQRAATDPNLFLLNGLDLYGEPDSAEHPLPDRLHPDAETHRLIGERFAALRPDGWFAQKSIQPSNGGLRR